MMVFCRWFFYLWLMFKSYVCIDSYSYTGENNNNLNKRLQRSYFLVNIAKFLWRFFLWNISSGYLCMLISNLCFLIFYSKKKRKKGYIPETEKPQKIHSWGTDTQIKKCYGAYFTYHFLHSWVKFDSFTLADFLFSPFWF